MENIEESNAERKAREDLDAMLNLIPNDFPVCMEDLLEIFSQEEKK
jgi:hypothetical protein